MVSQFDYSFKEFWESQFPQYSLDETSYKDYVSFRVAFDSVMNQYDRYTDNFMKQSFSTWLRKNFADANYGVSISLYDMLSKEMIEAEMDDWDYPDYGDE